MSRIGNNPINVPEGVTLEILPARVIVKGKLGELKQDYSDVKVKLEDNIITVSRLSENKKSKI